MADDQKAPMHKSPRRDPYRLTGETFGGRYRLEAFTGMGSFGAVYRATDTRVGRMVAVKILKPDLGDDEAEGARELFQREALTAGRLTHPHIVAVTDVGEESDFAYLVMEWLEGSTLEDELRTRVPFSPEETALLLAPISDALSAAHNSGVIHRDIKPSNIHLGRRERPYVKVLDFGIAKVVTSSTAAAASRIAGTASYMSPEQIIGSRIDRRTDIYSLGILLYQMLTGDVPFKGESQGHIIQQHIAVNPPSLRDARPDLPVELSNVIQRALNKLPEARQQSANELHAEFVAALKSKDTPQRISHSSELKTEVLAPQMPPTIVIPQYYEPRVEPPPVPDLRQQQPTIPIPATVTSNPSSARFTPASAAGSPPFSARAESDGSRNPALMPLLALAGAILFPLFSLLAARVVFHGWLSTEDPEFSRVIIGMALFGMLFGITVSGLRGSSHILLFAFGGAGLLFVFTLLAPGLMGVDWQFDEAHRYRFLLLHHLLVGLVLGLAVCALLRSPVRHERGIRAYLFCGAAGAIILMLLFYIYQLTTYPAEFLTSVGPGYRVPFTSGIEYFFRAKKKGWLGFSALGFVIGMVICWMRINYKENVR